MTPHRIALFAVPLASACVCVGLPPDAIYACDDGGCDGGGADGGCQSSGLPNLPDDCFTDDDHDGIDGQADASVFVDPVSGDDSHAGTMAAPVKTLSAALSRAVDGGLSTVLVAQGELDESFSWTHPVSIYGGYIVADAGWRRAWAPALLDGGAVAIHVTPWAGSAVLDNVNVRAADAPPGGSSVAMVVEGGSVVLRNLQLRAGSGGPGADDAGDEAAAQDGVPGSDGAPGQSSNDDAGQPSNTVGGAAGVATMCSGPSGMGGDGAAANATPGGSVTMTGQCNAKGGESSLPTGGADCDAGFAGGQDGEDGRDGPDGQRGPDGDAGASIGTLAGISYVPADGADGRHGLAGTAGCSGGGGGSSRRSSAIASGGSGASGGTGGCGGAGGHAGRGGGASIGLLIIDGGLTLFDAGVFAGFGGNGGRGYTGKPGAVGADGGHGGRAGDVCGTVAGNSGRGGNGGRGGDGGVGGSAGGGGGGPSIGIWCVRSSLSGDLRPVAARDGGAGGPADPPTLAGGHGLTAGEFSQSCN